MKKLLLIIFVLCLSLAWNSIFAQANFITVIDYHTTNAASEINNGKYNDAANSFQSAIEVFFTELNKDKDNIAFIKVHIDLLLRLKYDQLWCFALILEEGTVKNFDYMMEGINLNFNAILSSPAEPKSFIIENVYTVRGIIKYHVEQLDYIEDLGDGGVEGLRFMQRILEVKEMGFNSDHKPAMKPIFSTKISQKITREFIEGIIATGRTKEELNRASKLP